MAAKRSRQRVWILAAGMARSYDKSIEPASAFRGGLRFAPSA